MAGTLNAVSTPEENFLRFEVRDGMRRISCAVSDQALEAMSGLTVPSTVVLRRRSFDRFRTLIDAAAKLKLETLPSGFVGPLVLTTEDLRSAPPQAGIPLFGSSARSLTRPASHIDRVPGWSASTSNRPAPLNQADHSAEECQ
jgi:Protein of unknown function (DUF1488)